MIWYRNLYAGSLIRRRADRIIEDISSGKYPAGIWLVTLPGGEANQLQIIPADSLRQAREREDLPMIAGIALGRDEAVLLVEKMLRDSLKAGNGAEIRQFLLDQEYSGPGEGSRDRISG